MNNETIFFKSIIGNKILLAHIASWAYLVVICLIIYFSIFNSRKNKNRKEIKVVRKLFFPCLIAFYIFLTLLGKGQAIDGYLLSNTEIVIKASNEDKSIHFEKIKSIYRDSEKRYRIAYNPWYFINYGGSRSSSLWGIQGKYKAGKLGLVEVYVTDPSKVVVIDIGYPLILSPDQPERFIAALKMRLSQNR